MRQPDNNNYNIIAHKSSYRNRDRPFESNQRQDHACNTIPGLIFLLHENRPMLTPY